MPLGFWIMLVGAAVTFVSEALNRFLPFRLRSLRRGCRFYGVLSGMFIQLVGMVVLIVRWAFWR